MNHTRRGFLSLLPGLSALAHVPVLGWMFSREKRDDTKLLNVRARFMGAPQEMDFWMRVGSDESIILWIPVAERLPDRDTLYVFHGSRNHLKGSRSVLMVQNGIVQEGRFWLNVKTGEDFWLKTGLDPRNSVWKFPATHWADMPSAPPSPWDKLGYGVPQLPISEPL